MVLPTGLLVRGLRARQRLLPVPSTSTSCAPGASSMVRAYIAVSRVSERLQTTSCRGTAPLAESRGVDSLLQWLFAAPRVARRGLRAQQACAESATPSASPHLGAFRLPQRVAPITPITPKRAAGPVPVSCHPPPQAERVQREPVAVWAGLGKTHSRVCSCFALRRPGAGSAWL